MTLYKIFLLSYTSIYKRTQNNQTLPYTAIMLNCLYEQDLKNILKLWLKQSSNFCRLMVFEYNY